jgi:glucokinase
MTPQPALAIGVDLGASKIAAALVARQGQIVATTQQATPLQQGPEAILAVLLDSIAQLVAQAPAPIAGIGLGVPGRVDPVAGVVQNAVNLGWAEMPLLTALQGRLGKAWPIFIHRDSNAEVLGEAYFGAGQGCSTLIYLGLGSGLGGGVLVNGHLLLGDNLTASEIGHLSLNPQGRPCGCGQRGCAETIVSGNGVLALTRDYLAEGRYPTHLVDTPRLNAVAIVVAAQQGDALALAVLQEVAGWLGQIVAIYATLLNPARIIIGGGFGRAAFDLLLPGVQAALQQYAIPMSYHRLQLFPSQLTSSAVGAACLVWHHQQPGKEG